MCTLTAVPLPDGVQVYCNRDERRSRAAARPPRTQRLGDRLATFPSDPPRDGTWIGVNDRGLVVALLNRTMPDDRPAVATLRCSRGVVTRHALAAATLDHAVARVTALPLRAFDPFVVVVIHDAAVATVRNDGWAYSVTEQPLHGPIFFTSSSLGDQRVLQPRLDLFDRLVAGAREPWLMQGTFHRQRWAEHPELSVEMSRADAATVSRTWITVSGDRITMSYQPLNDEGIDTPTITEIPCTSSPASSSRPSSPRTSRLSAPVC